MELLPFLCDPTRTTVDAGANWGSYSYYAARHSKRVVAYEPLTHVAQALERGFKGQPCEVVVRNVALSDRTSRTVIRMPRDNIGYSTIEPLNQFDGTANTRGGVVEIPVETIRLDDEVIGKIGLIKIDVEGHEVAVLAGGVRTIERDRPNLIVECEERHRSGAVGELLAFAERFSYAGFFFLRGSMLPIERFSLPTHQDTGSPSDYVRNFVFVCPDSGAALQEFAARVR